jgi:Flp pilus assembly protein TadD
MASGDERMPPKIPDAQFVPRLGTVAKFGVVAESEDDERVRPNRLPSFRPPTAGGTDVVKVPKNVKVSEPPIPAQAGKRRPLPPVEEDKRLIGSDPPEQVIDVDSDVAIPPLKGVSDLDEPDVPVEVDVEDEPEDVAMRRGRKLPGTREPTERIARATEEPKEDPDTGVGRWIAVVAVVLAAAIVAVVFVTLPEEGPRRARREAEAEAETETETETEAEAEAETESEAQAEAEAGTGTGEGMGTGTGEGMGTGEEPSIDDLAALPEPRPEVAHENPWVRLNRAADIRQEARRHYMNGRLRVAHREFLHSLEWDPESSDAMRYLSRTLQRMGDLDSALAWARRSVETDPDDPRNYELLGDQLLMFERTEEAIAVYEQGLEKAPRDRRLRSRVRRLP